MSTNLKEFAGAGDAFQAELATYPADKLVMAYVYSDSCGYCRRMHPNVEEMAAAFPDVQILRLDCSKCRGAYLNHVRALPAFWFHLGGKPIFYVEEPLGASMSKAELRGHIEATIALAQKEVAKSAAAATAPAGTAAAEAPAAAAPAAASSTA